MESSRYQIYSSFVTLTAQVCAEEPELGHCLPSSCLGKEVPENPVDHIQRLIALQHNVVGIQVLPPPLFHLQHGHRDRLGRKGPQREERTVNTSS